MTFDEKISSLTRLLESEAETRTEIELLRAMYDTMIKYRDAIDAAHQTGAWGEALALAEAHMWAIAVYREYVTRCVDDGAEAAEADALWHKYATDYRKENIT